MDSKKDATYPFLLFRGHYFKHTELKKDPPEALEVEIVESIVDGDLRHCLDGSLLPLRMNTLVNPADLKDIEDAVIQFRNTPITRNQILIYGHRFLADPSVPVGKVRFTNDNHNFGPPDLYQDLSFVYAYYAYQNPPVQKYFVWIKKTWARVVKFFSRKKSISDSEFDRLVETMILNLKERNPDDPDET